MLAPIDTASLKRDHPIADIIGGYGIALRPSGRTLVGRCPFHPDRGRPNLAVYPASHSWYCFRCGCGGDAISFVERMEGVGFRDAVDRIQGVRPLPGAGRIVHPARPRLMRSRPAVRWGAVERACLTAAVELYHNRLLTDRTALAYVEGRGIDRATLAQSRVGYASGDELAAYLRWRGLPLQAAVRTGLLGRGGREFLAERVVVPEMRAGQPIWLIGRTLGSDPCAGIPKYLGLPGRKPLLGWESAISSEEVWVTEGPFDWLTLRSWGLPAVALVGTHVRAVAVQALARFARVYLVLDSDEAGQAATDKLVQELGSRATPVMLPGVKDVAELAVRADGRSIFTRLIEQRDAAEPGFAQAA